MIFIVGLAFVVERLRQLHARFPRFAPHAALALAAAPFILMNVDQACTSVKPPTDVPQPIDEAYGAIARRTVEHLAGTPLGSPTAWPTSWLWGAWHHISPRRWDTLVGGERLFIPPDALDRPGRTVADVVHLDEHGVKIYAAGGVDRPATHGAPALVHDGGRLLIPLFVGDNVTWILDLTAPAGGTVTVNGEVHAIPASLSPSQVTLKFGDGVLHPGVNEVVFHSAPAEIALSAVDMVWKCPR